MAGDRLSLTRLNRDSTWSSERIAQELVPLRDRLVERLSHEIAAARDLTLDQRELVIDDAIDFLVTQYVKPVRTREELDRAFWAAASYRVKRAFEGRSATVRGGYRRVDLEDLDRIAAGENPEEAVVRRDERLTLLEFAATLSPRERKVLACKYGNGREVLGRKLISRALGLPIGEVRKAERELARKLERFAALVAASSLCSFRGRVILSLAASTASDDEAAAARLHLKRCPACRRVYAARLRAMRTGQFQRELAGLLPVPVVERLAEERPLRWPVIDWLSRPFSGDGTAVAAQAASTGTGRGLGAVAAVKLASLCIGGAALTGGAAVCIQQVATPSPPANDRAHRARPSATVDATIPVAEVPARRPRVGPVPLRATDQGGERDRDRKPDPAEHETTVPASPPPAGAQAGGVDEFGPSSTTGPSTPASAPATGAPEFP